jgi:hypothetical protein
VGTKTALLCIAGALLLGGAIGRFTLPAKVVTKTITAETDKKQSETDRNTQNHTVITTTTTKKPDGSVVTIVTQRNNVVTSSQTKAKETDSKHSETDKTVTYNTSRWFIGALAVSRPFSGTLGIKYGGEASYRLIGPFRVGVLGVSDGTLGASLGIQF